MASEGDGLRRDDDDDDDDDLYGDLDFGLDRKKRASGAGNHPPVVPLPPPPIGHNRYGFPATGAASASSSSQRRRQQQQQQQQQADAQLLTAKVERLEAENLRLKRSIGTLFRTAKHEMKRKDERIELLERRLDERHQQQQQPSSGSRDRR